MKHSVKHSLLIASLTLLPGSLAFADHHNEVLYSKLVQPILNAKCVACHGAEKQKGKLRLDSFEEVMKGSDGSNVVPGKLEESYLVERIDLPLDDDDHMPPEDEPQLTKQEIAVLKFWVQSGAKADAKIGDLKPAADVTEAIKFVIANPPKGAAAAAPAAVAKIDPAKQKLAEETIKKVEAAGASLMAIAQDTPDLRFSALNVAKEYGDKNLELLKPVADQIKWMDLARSQVTDGGLANLAGMKNLSRLHLENTKITDAGLDHLKGLANLEYLNLYGTQVTDAGIAKLGALKKLKKLFVWQTKVTDEGAKKLASAVPGLYVNTGWKEPGKPVTVAANTPPKTEPKPAPKPAPKPPTPKPTPKPAPKPANPTPASNAQTIASLGATIDKALADAKAASEAAKTTAAAASKSAGEAKTVAEAAKKAGEESGKVAADARKTAGDSLKAATEAKAAADAAKKAATDAQTAAAAAQKAAQAANQIAVQAKTALEELQKAAAAIAGAAGEKK